MKKIATLFFLFIICILLNKEDTVQPTAMVEEFNKDASFCYVTFKQDTITTHNFINYFKEIEVLSVTPYQNPLYKTEPFTYYLTSASLTNNIEAFTKKYQKYLYNKGYIEASNKIYITGIPLQNTKIICNQEIYQKLKKISTNITQREN